MEVRFTIRGEPKGKGRPRFCRNTGHAMTPKDTVNYETLVRTEYSAAYPEFKFPDGTMLDMRIMAYYSIPKSASKKKKASMLANEIRPTKKPDMDNVVKIIADSLNQVAYRDDTQIVDCQCRKFYGDFGLFLIDENNNAIGGNQRATTMAAQDPDRIVLCKRLIGYSEADLRAINIKDNTHAGEWDLDLLADWTADLTTDLGLDLKELDPNERKKKEMELINLEKYNYVLIVCKNELDYNELTRNLGIDGAIVRMGSKKKLKARAVWYHDMKAQIVSAADAGSLDQEEESQEGVEDEEG